MVKQTQTIRRQFANKLFECVRPFCGIGAKWAKLLIALEQNILQGIMQTDFIMKLKISFLPGLNNILNETMVLVLGKLFYARL